MNPLKRIYAIEKNTNAVTVMLKKEHWSNVTVIQADMRHFSIPEKVSIQKK